MINIAHPKVTTKPPINKFNSGKKRNQALIHQQDNKNIYEERKKFGNNVQSLGDCPDCSVHESFLEVGSCDSGIDGIFKSMEIEMKQHHGSTTSDCNQNVIESNSCSLEQLCSIINDLEKNLSDEQEIVSVETCCLPVEHHPIASDDKYLNQTPPEKDTSRSPCTIATSTYEDIMTFLGTLEQDYSILECQNNPGQLQQLSKDADKLESFIVHSQTEINRCDRTKDDLATALLKLEDREATLKLLKEEFKSERKVACDKLENQKKEHSNELQMQKTKYQNVIKRHQKFIEQLIDEKKHLSEQCNALAQKIKEIELKHQRELKVAIDRHTVELQRAKELCQASEKIRRERWLEVKTSKIKEMTVKGLEPELRNMVDQHQQEIQEIRSTHIKELQDVELRAIRRSNQQLEQLRLELTASHDKVLANEKEAMRLRYQEKLNEQETLMQVQQRKFFDELQQEKKKYTDEQARRDMDRDASVQQISSEYQEQIDKMMKQFEVDKKILRETIEAEYETWKENYKRQQTSKFEMAEIKIRDDSNRERDRQIELAISRLEKESRDMMLNLQRTSDNKLQCLKDKYDADFVILKDNEKLLREKYVVAQEKLDSFENNFRRIENQLSQCQADLNEANRLVDKMTKERDHAKKLARQEIECEKRELEEKISSLYKEITQINFNRESHMAQLYSRIKLIITQKDIMLKNMSKKVNDIQSKYDHLEKLLDQQRKEYVLKTL